MSKRITYTYPLAIALLAAVVAYWSDLNATDLGAEDDKPRSSLFKFSHRFHIVDAGVEDCNVCHAAATTSILSSDNLLGTKENCQSCHDVENPDECSKCHAGEATPEKFMNPLRDIRFSHEVHVTGGKMECTACHRGLESTDFASAANMPSMETCMSCHNGRVVSSTCESCHLNLAAMFPVNHQRSDFRRNHRDEVRLGAIDVSCQTCHAETFCQECHLGGGLKSFGTRDRMVDPGPVRSSRDKVPQTILQNVHSLNYRFTHGIDAKAKQSECASCHVAQTFCVDCHQAGGHVTQAKFKPTSHSLAGFTTLGRGSGGGLHAEEARRDLENCMSCHDVEGRDPTCLVCHDDNGFAR